MAQLKWYFEDFEPGRTIPVGSRTVDQDEIIAFARQFDPQPFHVDPEAAAKSMFGGIIASGWHTCSMMMRMMVDTLAVTTTVLDARPSSSRPDRGVVHTMWEAKNQHGETVATVKGMGMFLRRPEQG